MNLKCPLILGSKSPRRKELLKQLGLTFRTQSIDTDESFPNDIHWKDVASYIASKKAEAFRNIISDELVLTSDTIVAFNSQVLGKPASRKEAMHMIRLLSGETHHVVTGVCLLYQDKIHSFDDTTIVQFRELKDAEIEYYVDTFKPFDKAGAYGIQEWLGMVAIEKIEGSFFNVMGLPVHKVFSALQPFVI